MFFSLGLAPLLFHFMFVSTNLEETITYCSLEGVFLCGASLCRLCESNIFGARAIFGMDASLVFLQGVLAVVPLIGGVFDVVVFNACSGMLGRASSLICGRHSPVHILEFMVHNSCENV